MTEDEAKTKWCHAYRESGEDANNRPVAYEQSPETGRTTAVRGSIHVAARCIASNCMAWRWSVGRNTGFCGIAGQPS